MSDDPIAWNRVLDELISERGFANVRRAVVVSETASTQDAARELASGRPGLVLIACRQNSGRGRLGRRWHDSGEQGLAATFVLDAAELDGAFVSIAAGLAACRAAEALIGSGARLGLRWPNDVVQPRTAGSPSRKLAGVLIEHVGGMLLVGIGLNVSHAEKDFPPDIRHAATSLAMLGAGCTRREASLRLVEELDRVLELGHNVAIREWSARDVLVGTRRTFLHAGREVTGLVEAVAPTTHIRVKTDTGAQVLLPALTTSLVHDADPAPHNPAT